MSTEHGSAVADQPATEQQETAEPSQRSWWRRLPVLLVAALLLGVTVVLAVARLSGDDTSSWDDTQRDAPSQDAAPGSWDEAWASGDAEVIRDWFEANTGPTLDVEGEIDGGVIRDQEDADRLTGHVVTSEVRVDCDCELRDFVLEEAMLWVDGGDVTVRNVTLDGRGTTDLVGAFTARRDSVVHLANVEITGHHDGVRAYAEEVTGEYLYVHGVAEDNPEDHHEDGIQTIGGTTDFQRSFIDMRGGNTSATLIKPDSRPIPSASINYSVLMGGGYTFHVHDGPEGTPGTVDLSNNLVAPGYGTGLVSTWRLTDPEDVLVSTYATVSGTGERVELVDGARIPGHDGDDD